MDITELKSTKRELENIQKIIPEILSLDSNIDILVVDDNSPDGTGKFVDENYASEKRIHILHRKEKNGLGKAYIAGMKKALEYNYKFIVQMDADFSHRPIDLQKLIDVSNDYDLVIGSRWVPGGKVVNWSFSRKFISKFGSFYASTILRKPIKDWTGGFNLWRAEKLRSFGLDTINSSGYSFQIEMKNRALNKKFKHYEQAIEFVDRDVGESKMSKKIILEALFRVWTFR